MKVHGVNQLVLSLWHNVETEIVPVQYHEQEKSQKLLIRLRLSIHKNTHKLIMGVNRCSSRVLVTTPSSGQNDSHRGRLTRNSRISDHIYWWKLGSHNPNKNSTRAVLWLKRCDPRFIETVFKLSYISFPSPSYIIDCLIPSFCKSWPLSIYHLFLPQSKFLLSCFSLTV